MSLLLPTLLAFVAVTVPAAGAQGPAPRSTQELADLLQDLRKLRRGPADGDAEAARILTELERRFAKLEKRDQHEVARAVEDCFMARRKPNEVRLYLDAGEALSEFGRHGADALARVVDDRRFRGEKEWIQLRAHLIRLLGRPGEERHVKTLTDIARKDNDDLAAAKAGEALGDYQGHDEKIRKEIVRELVKALEQTHARSQGHLAGGRDAHASGRRYAVIRGPWMSTLRKLTGQHLSTPLAWRDWWEDHKYERWDKKERPKTRK